MLLAIYIAHERHNKREAMHITLRPHDLSTTTGDSCKASSSTTPIPLPTIATAKLAFPTIQPIAWKPGVEQGASKLIDKLDDLAS
jgi:hypothetical protein